MSEDKNVGKMFESGVPKIERYFNDASDVSFEDIINSIIQSTVESYLNGSYYHNKVNVATSNEEVA